jgi:SNF2 family DNA or RNA helicase
MRQWEKEIQHHIQPRHRLKVYLYWGKGKKADFSVLRQYDIVLTTFGTLTSEFKQKESRRETMFYEREMNEPGFRRRPQDKLALLGRECMWYRIIIDEAHTIKNRNAIASKASVDLQARHRLCMTGTPIMNSVDELYPLLRFLRVDRYSDWKMFSADIGKVSLRIFTKTITTFFPLLTRPAACKKFSPGDPQKGDQTRPNPYQNCYAASPKEH